MTPAPGWREFFDAHAPLYEDNEFTGNTVREVDFLLERLGVARGARILDVGCGTGRHAVELAGRGYRVTGVDLSAGMLHEAVAKARSAGVEVHWIQADAARFRLRRPFDAALCLCEGAFGLLGEGDDPIEHPLSILRNVTASLGPGARSIFTVLNGAAMLRRHTQEDVDEGRLDPRSLVSASDFAPREGAPPIRSRERAFVPTELRLLFRLAGMEVLATWGGTAGRWGERSLELDEMEIMVLARRTIDA